MAKPKKKTTKRVHPAQTPAGYVITGLLMWVVGYLLFILAVDSGSYLQWAGVFTALVWGFVRVIEGSYQYIKQR